MWTDIIMSFTDKKLFMFVCNVFMQLCIIKINGRHKIEMDL